MKDLSLAQSYAAAIFKLAVDRETVRPTADDLERLSLALTSDEGVFSFFADPTVPTGDKSRVLSEVSGALDVSPDCLGLCEVMIENGRMAIFPEVVAAARKMAADFERRTEAWVTAAHDLPPEEEKRLQGALGELTGKSVSLHVDVDSTLIGGVVVRIENTVIDGSVAGRLRVFAEESKDTADGDSSG